MYICRVNSSSAFKTSYLPLASTDKNKRVCVASQNITYTYVATTLYLRSKHIALAAWNNNHTMQSVPFVAANVSFLTATHTHKHKNWRHCLFLQTSALHLLAYQLFISIQKQLVVIACLEHTCKTKQNRLHNCCWKTKRVWLRHFCTTQPNILQTNAMQVPRQLCVCAQNWYLQYTFFLTSTFFLAANADFICWQTRRVTHSLLPAATHSRPHDAVRAIYLTCTRQMNQTNCKIIAVCA